MTPARPPLPDPAEAYHTAMAAQEAAAAPPGESLFGLSEAARERRSEAAEMAAQATAALQASGAGAAGRV